jgi:glutamyl-tRNA reductase
MTTVFLPEARAREGTGAATIVALSAHARHVPSPAREAFGAALARLEPSPAAIFVRTCHRVELYVAAGGLDGQTLPEPPPGTVRLQDVEAAEHLISVACGLDSAVLGEHQILHQIRETLNDRHEEGSLDPVLERLFQAALHAGRRSHSWLSGAPRSLGDVAVERVLQGEPEPELPLLVVGAGIMGRLAAHAAARHGREVLVTNRTGERAAAVAREVGGHTLPYAARGSLPRLAGVVVALSAVWEVDADAQRELVDSGVSVVDLSSPPAVPDSLHELLGSRYVSADDLAWSEEGELQTALRAKLERLVHDTGRDFCHWLRTRNSVPALKAVAEAAEGQRRSELEWLLHRLPDLSDDERQLVEQMSNRLVAAILHAPRTALSADESGNLSRAARELFGV